MTQRFACILILLSAILWGLSGLLTKVTMGLGVSALETAFWRMLFAGLLFALHAIKRSEFRLKTHVDFWAFAGFAIFAMALHYVGFNLAVEHGGVSLVSLFLSCVPVVVAICSRLFLKEKLTSGKGLLVSLSVIGLLLVARGNGQGVVVNDFSVGFSLIAAVSGIIYTVASKRLLAHYSPIALNAFVMPLGALSLLPFITFSHKSLLAWLLLLVLTVFPTYLAHLFFQLGLKKVEATRAALLVNVKAVIALFTAALFLGERLTLCGLLGAGMTLLVMSLVVLPNHAYHSIFKLRPFVRESQLKGLSKTRLPLNHPYHRS